MLRTNLEPAEKDAVIGDLSMLVRRLCSKLPEGDKLRAQAMDYLQRKGLQGSPLRNK